MRRRNKMAGAGRSQAGFTLLELVVTMMVSSLVVLAAYQLFASTSEAMYEANSLSDTTDRARFGLEMMARDVRAAGAFGSPESTTDPFVFTAQLNARHVRGIYAFTDHQEQQIRPFQSLWNQATSSDELIVMGAYDFPFSFEVAFEDGQYDSAFASNSERGALRFLKVDPFIVDDLVTDDLGNMVNSLIGPSSSSLIESRVMRVMDRNGFSQFVPITGATYNAGIGNGLTLDLEPNTLQERIGDARAGLEPAGEDDVAYEAALLDAYRYRVCRPDNDESRLQLVRERLDASRLINNEVPPTDDICEDVDTGPGEYVIERSMIVDRVVDFQVWYDCVLPAASDVPVMEASVWDTNWRPPGTMSADAHNCMYVDSSGVPVSDPALARMAHIRLSVRTENERSNVSNYGFLRQSGTTVDTVNVSGTPNASDYITSDPALSGALGHLQTADLNNDASNAARVVTMQIDVQLTNYINRADLSSPN